MKLISVKDQDYTQVIKAIEILLTIPKPVINEGEALDSKSKNIFHAIEHLELSLEKFQKERKKNDD